MSYVAPVSDFGLQSDAAFDGPLAKHRQSRGKMSYHAGLAAEDQVCADYERRGYSVLKRRWRGQSGEIDVIARDGDGVIIIEVKKSRSFGTAIAQLTSRQMQRIYATTEEFLGQMPKGALTDVRFDVAMLNAAGEISILENAFGHG